MSLTTVKMVLPTSIKCINHFYQKLGDYCVFPYMADKTLYELCHRIFCKGLEIGNYGYEMNMNVAGALFTDKGKFFGAGWSTY